MQHTFLVKSPAHQTPTIVFVKGSAMKSRVQDICNCPGDEETRSNPSWLAAILFKSCWQWPLISWKCRLTFRIQDGNLWFSVWCGNCSKDQSCEGVSCGKNFNTLRKRDSNVRERNHSSCACYIPLFFSHKSFIVKLKHFTWYKLTCP